MEYTIHPLTALLIASFAIGVITVFFYPEKGMLSRWIRLRKNNERILIEDALKHVYNYAYNNIDCTLHSLAGNLSISGERTAKLTEKLISLGLIKIHTGNIDLTDRGRSYALRIIRVHRLWERYLADETGVSEKHWHTEAEIKEHDLSPDDTEKLAAQLGHPVTDPHGDPIPSSSGEITSQPGIPLNSLEKGTYARIVHLEDEPEAIYAQLVAEGLHTGMQVRIIEQTEKRIILEADGNESVLAPLFAGQIQVTPIQKHKDIQHNFLPLSALNVGEEACVVALSRKIRGQQRRRLMDLGLVPGTSVSAVIKSTGDDPTAYHIRGALIALRKTQTDGIFIQRTDGNEHEKHQEM